MDSRSTDRLEEFPSVETPEDVAVLYSWANLHGAKYRDFSASRREYRAQLRHRAAEQAREQELQAQAHAEAAAVQAERASRQAQHQAQAQAQEAEVERQRTLQRAEDSARVAAAERIEAARRAEGAALAEAEAQRERREIVEANASARRQAAQYAESDSRRRYAAEPVEDAELPGRISDPYTPSSRSPLPSPADVPEPAPADEVIELHPTRYRGAPDWSADREKEQIMSYDEAQRSDTQPERWRDRVYENEPAVEAPRPTQAREHAPQAPAAPAPARRPQGYRPDDASGVREIYRGSASQAVMPAQRRQLPATARQAAGADPYRNAPSSSASRSGAATRLPEPSHRRTIWAGSPDDRSASRSAVPAYTPDPAPLSSSASPAGETPRRRRQDLMPDPRIDSGSGRVLSSPDRRRVVPPEAAAEPAMDNSGYPWTQGTGSPSAGAVPQEARGPQTVEPVGPAWIYAPRDAKSSSGTIPVAPPAQSSVADTLQHSRERVASRWYALKDVFEQPGQTRPEPEPVRQKETRTPVLAVFSLAGGVGKTSLVATLGRALSSMGEKALLTDTTSHGLLPFYFGASELRQGTVRTFSPPSGSTDAPIYLVSYDIEDRRDEDSQQALVEEIHASGRGTHRVLLDASPHSAWLLRRIAHLSPTVLVPVAPDMNSVISLGGVEKIFRGLADAEGAPVKVFYVLNQFDASLPLHLDVREVLRRQLGDKLLPFVIRRAPMVSEALAEGMTIIDYSPDNPVAEDYLNVATWLRSHAAPATTGFRTVRWSER